MFCVHQTGHWHGPSEDGYRNNRYIILGIVLICIMFIICPNSRIFTGTGSERMQQDAADRSPGAGRHRRFNRDNKHPTPSGVEESCIELRPGTGDNTAVWGCRGIITPDRRQSRREGISITTSGFYRVLCGSASGTAISTRKRRDFFRARAASFLLTNDRGS